MFFIMVKQDANNITNLIFTPVVMISETRNFTVIRLLYFQIIITKFSHVQTANKKSWIVFLKKWTILSSTLVLVILFFVMWLEEMICCLLLGNIVINTSPNTEQSINH